MSTKQDIAQESIDSILQDNFSNDLIPVDDSNKLPAFNTTQSVNYVDLKSKSVNKAKKLLNSLLHFYLSEELISKNDYIAARA